MTPVLLLPAGPDTYAVLLGSVREVVPGPDPTPLPTAPRTVLGLLNVRGEIVPLLDTGALAGGTAAQTSAYAVVVDAPSGPAALSATGLPQVAELGDAVAGAETPGSMSTHAVGDRLVMLLDVELLVTPGRILAPHERLSQSPGVASAGHGVD